MDILVGDFGGTNCRFALARNGRVIAGTRRDFVNQDHPSPVAAINTFLEELAASDIRAVCVAAAGPVHQEAVSLTNYPWKVYLSEVLAAAGAQSGLILNDLQAQGYALFDLGSSETRVVVEAQGDQDGPRLIVSIGTGINAAICFKVGSRIFVPPSEAGHMAFGAQSETDLKIAQRLRVEFGHNPLEAILSGRGLVWLYRFFGGKNAQDSKEVIQAFDAKEPAASVALRCFSEHLARFCTDLALVHMPSGGIYLSGSVGVAVSDYLQSAGFSDLFRRSGPYRGMLERIPVSCVPDVQMTLRGCAIAMDQSL